MQKKTGYSVNTVSIALNREGRVSKETRDIIRKCAEEMGYIPNVSAQKMRTGKSHLFALILDNISDPILSVIASDIAMYAAYNNYDVLMYITHGDQKKEKKAILSAVARNVDGILVFPLDGFNDNISLMEKNNIPYVIVGRIIDEFSDKPSITVDDIRVGYLSAEHLALNGHKSVAIISYNDGGLNAELRATGIKTAFSLYGLSQQENNFFFVSREQKKRITDLNSILSNMDDYTAIICSDDILAYETIDCLRQEGKRVPEDISVIGFGNIKYRINAFPNITTIKTEDGVMAAEAIEMLIKQIDGRGTGKATIPVFLEQGATVVSR